MRLPNRDLDHRPAALWIVTGIAGLLTLKTGASAAEPPVRNRSGSGIFVSFADGTLTLKNKAGLLVYDGVDERFKTYKNNDDGPGAKRVPTVHVLSGGKPDGFTMSPPALSRVVPGTLVRVDMDAREIDVGFDFRIVGSLESYQVGQLTILAADPPGGFLKRPEGAVTVAVPQDTPVLESIDGGLLQFAGSAGKALSDVKPGTRITARSQYDVDAIEVIEIGTPRHRLERYIGETRGTVRGTFVSFQDGILRMRGKGLAAFAENEYERMIVRRIGPQIPISESVDGGASQPASLSSLNTLKEGATVTLRKVEDVILEVRIGVPK